MDNKKFWERQYRRNISRIYGLCYLYVGDYSVAEDLAHDAFLKAMEKFHTIRGIFNFDNWLKRIAINQCVDYLRQQPNFVPLPSEIADESSTVENLFKWEMEITEVELLESIQQLPELQRTVFNLFAIEGCSHRRIADLLGISVAYSKQLHCRARTKLGKMLADNKLVKDRLKKGLFMTLFISSLKKANSSSRRIDRLYRSRLSSFRLEPTHPLTISEIGKAAATVPSKIGVLIAAHKTALLLTAATGTTGGAIAWQVNSNASTGMDSGKTPIPVEARLGSSQHDEEEFKSNTDSIVEPNRNVSLQSERKPMGTFRKTSSQTTDNISPVIITKRVPVQKTVVVRDTTIISDTVYRIYQE